MRLPVEKKTENYKGIKLHPNGIYEIGGYGKLIEKFPQNRQIVKHAVTQELMDFRDSYICFVDKFKNCFYLKNGEKRENFDPNTMKPSNFKEMVKEG